MENILNNPHFALFIGLISTVVITALAYFLAGKLANILERLAVDKTRWEGDEQLIRFLKKSVRRLILLIGAFYFLGYLSDVLGESYKLYLNGIFYVLIVFVITFALMGLVSLAVRIYSKSLIEKKMLGDKEDFFPLLVRVFKIIIFIIALIIIMKHFKQDVQALVVSLGIGSLAIALAAQETLANMIAGFVIMTDRPFRVGDRIQLSSGEKGDVYEIGLRSTKVKTFDNTLLIVPNAEIVKEKILNLTYPDPITRVRVNVGVAYGTDVQKVKSILEEICNRHPRVLNHPPPNAYFLDFGDSSLDFFLTCRVPDWRDEWTIAEEIRLEIDRRFKEEGIEIPFPQRTLWWGDNPETKDKKGKPDAPDPEINPEAGDSEAV